MGDPRRFAEFAGYIARQWPDRSVRVADVAGGHGGLNAELHRLGYRNVVTFDRRKRLHKGRPHQRYGLFNEDVREPFDLVVAMHPDAATDEAMAWAIRRGVPFAVVPCCAKPSAWPAPLDLEWPAWVAHLENSSRLLGRQTRRDLLTITGRNLVLAS